MSKVTDLSKYSAEQLQEFLASFDIVLSDIDGVVWSINKFIDGSVESLRMLQKLGKEVHLVTNNSILKAELYAEKMQHCGFDIDADRIINTAKVIVWYLKKINFCGEVYVIASDVFKDVFIEAGLQLIEQPKVFMEDVPATVKEVLDRPSVKAVIVDFDVNCNWSMLSLALSCLKRKEVMYIAGAKDIWISSGFNTKILGPGPLVNLISAQSGKHPILCGKPSEILKDYILNTCNVSDPQKCLFIGDTIDQDMKFATMCGFIKLFVGSGCDTLEDAETEDDICPDYYLPSLGQLFSAYKESQNQHITNCENS